MNTKTYLSPIMSSVREKSRPDKFHEDWLDHKGSKSNAYSTLWAVLRGDAIYFFKNERTEIRGNLLGSLRLNEQTIITADKKKDKKFELESYTRDGIKKKNFFKCKDSTSRDLWKSFIIGISKGIMPQDVHLLPGQIHKVEDAIHFIHRQRATPSERGPPLPPRPRATSLGGFSTGSMRSEGGSVGSGDRASISAASRHSVESNYDTRLPDTRHKFFIQEEMNDEIPSWFFPNCSREKAEQLLDSGKRYGNCLMRESTSHRQTGSYVISYRKDKDTHDFEICHYEVARVSEGYLIVLENEPQKTSQCLSDVMTYFTTICGRSAVAMKTNDWAILGAKYPDYVTRMPRLLPTDKENGETLYPPPGGSAGSSVRTSRSSTGSESVSSYQKNWDNLANRTSQDSGSYYNLNEFFPPFGGNNDREDYVNESEIEALHEDFDHDYYNEEVFEAAARQIMHEQEDYENEHNIQQLSQQAPWSPSQSNVPMVVKNTPTSLSGSTGSTTPPAPPPIATIPHRSEHKRETSEGHIAPPVDGPEQDSAFPKHRTGRRFSEPAVKFSASLQMSAVPAPPQPDEILDELQRKLHLRRSVVDNLQEDNSASPDGFSSTPTASSACSPITQTPLEAPRAPPAPPLPVPPPPPAPGLEPFQNNQLQTVPDIPTEPPPPPPIQKQGPPTAPKTKRGPNVNEGRPLPAPPGRQTRRTQSASAVTLGIQTPQTLHHSASASEVPDHAVQLRQKLQERFIYSTPDAFMKK
ncbi:uncharacterized protein LOC106162226 isoform X2 [Lingula anatina]|uniref:Uncharacterized protein LOC106162226 isoform X2 n=1 Tax=Lingula anatina TaxID=7574 RepID=A0A1S3IBU1_LINAN|nr:uncharacterized protein LOC106162226 isoform X2 [Lingula anatina]|eukprot:XP_013394894.1 uncharacterized protein LOC106162226 isoform X2 [Lingula anatina]